MRNWNEIFANWSKGPGQTEEERISNSIKMINDAIKSSDKLNKRNIDVFVQGSYRNRVNVRKESDIDIGVVCRDVFFLDYPKDENVKKRLQERLPDGNYLFKTFKDEIEEALVTKFGRDAVTRSNKAFDIKATSYRVEADVAPFFEHKRYTTEINYITGVEMRPDNSPYNSIINWPEQHYENGVAKNQSTKRKYKRIVRILKKLSIEMENDGIAEASKIPGFLTECLAWNVRNEILVKEESYYETIRNVLLFLYSNTKEEDKCSEWGEVSELKYLFKGHKKWTVSDVNKFVIKAFSYIGYDNE